MVMRQARVFTFWSHVLVTWWSSRSAKFSAIDIFRVCFRSLHEHTLGLGHKKINSFVFHWVCELLPEHAADLLTCIFQQRASDERVCLSAALRHTLCEIFTHIRLLKHLWTRLFCALLQAISQFLTQTHGRDLYYNPDEIRWFSDFTCRSALTDPCTCILLLKSLAIIVTVSERVDFTTSPSEPASRLVSYRDGSSWRSNKNITNYSEPINYTLLCHMWGQETYYGPPAPIGVEMKKLHTLFIHIFATITIQQEKLHSINCWLTCNHGDVVTSPWLL